MTGKMFGSKLSAICWGITAIEQRRGFATLKDISIRLKSVRNIQKITKSMKMVSAAKYNKAERELRGARVYGVGALQFYNNIGAAESKDKLQEGTITSGEKEKRLLVLITSDRGLCGSVHTAVAKEAKRLLTEKASEAEYKLVLIGDKAKASMQILHANQVLFSCNEIGRLPPTFEDASVIAAKILSSNYKFDKGFILYNKFRSVVSYKTSIIPMFTLDAIVKQPTMSMYDSIDDNVLNDYANYSLAQLLYYALKESAASEQSSRMTAMDSASKNAGEMIDKLTMSFNRTRQSVITRELIEIISGAACV
uniref:ATP synthase subunit gamma n=3 Tax=Brugia TaxID=6278 RepID=A0A1I9GD19_BRUMA|nr:Bm13860 [Brugia malayi]